MRDIFLENTTIAFYFMAEQKEQTRATYNNNKKKKYENVSTFFWEYLRHGHRISVYYIFGVAWPPMEK